ncbi:MAG: hypothetical protein WCX65_08530 [bacterium]
MNEDLRIALIGAAGMSFGPVTVYDTIMSEKARGATLVLVDINKKRLDICYKAAVRLNEDAGSPVRIEKTSDIAKALDGAKFVLTSVENDRFKYWKQDYTIPKKYGSSQVMGENGGPGGLFHSLRSVKLTLSICADIEKYAPDAFVINLTNPMSRVCLAINRYTKLRNVGLCHEFHGGLERVAAALFTPFEDIDGEASGINHFTFFYKLTNNKTGEDLYPRVREHMSVYPLYWGTVVSRLFKDHGLLATSTDSHVAEYIPAPNKIKKLEYPFWFYFSQEWEMRNSVTMQCGDRNSAIPKNLIVPSGELTLPIIECMTTGERVYMGAVNVPNKGYVPNFPEGAMVEVAAYCDGEGIHPIATPPVKDSLAALMNAQIELQSLIVDAAAKGDWELAFEALLKDPQCPPDKDKARKMFDEMCVKQAKYLPF